MISLISSTASALRMNEAAMKSIPFSRPNSISALSFSVIDGKLTLTPEVGGHLVDYMPYNEVENLIEYCDNIYLDHGATKTVFGTNKEEFADIEHAATLAELKLVHSPVRHLGTEKSLAVLKSMQDYLMDRIDIINNEQVENLIIKDDTIKGFSTKEGNEYFADKT